MKWPKNWIILGTMQIGKANDHYDYASLKFRWKRWNPYFVTSINMLILTFTPPVLHFLVLHFPLSETWKHCSSTQRTTRRHAHNTRRTHKTHTAAAIESFYLGIAFFSPHYLLILRLIFQNINHRIIFGTKFHLICSRRAPVSRQSLMLSQSMQIAAAALQ